MNATNAKAYDKKTAAFIGFLVQNIPEISDESMNFWIDNPEALKRKLRGLNIKSQKVRQSFQFRTVDAVTTDLDAIPGKKTRLCFSDSWYSYRSDKINSLLPENQLRTEGCFIQSLALPKGITTATFVELSIAFLNVSKDTPVRTLRNFLKARDHTMTLPQIEKMVEITKRGLTTGIKTKIGEDNFFFSENRELKISVVRVSNNGSGWIVDLFDFEDGHQWPSSSHLLVRNLYLK